MSVTAIAMAGSKAFTAISKGATQMVNQVGKAVNSQIGIMASFNNVLTSALEPLTLITEPLATIGEVIGSSLYPVLEPLSTALYDLVPIIQPITDQIGQQLAPIMEQLAPVITALVPPLVQVGATIISALLPSVVSIFNAFLPLTPVVVSLVNAFMPLVPIVVTFLNPLTMFATKMEFLTPMIEAIVPYLQKFADATGVVINGLTGVIQWFMDLPSKILEALTNTDIGGKIKNWWDGLWD